jgi:hypothetical protein
VPRCGRGTHLLIVDGSNAPALDHHPAPSHEERVAQLFIAGMALACEGHVGRLRRVFFISEAWLSTAQGGVLPDVLPSQDPNRKEVLIISAYAPGTQQTDLAIFEMIRDSDGALQALHDFAQPGESEAYTKSPLLMAFVNGFLSRIN